jgi:hypothetical protein
MTQKNQKTQKSHLIPIFLGVIGGLIILPIVYLLAVQPFIPNHNLHSADKAAQKIKMQTLIGNISLPSGEIVYSEVRDRGCDDRNAAYFETKYTCNLIAQKYVRASGDIKQDLAATDQILQNAGLKPDPSNTFGGSSKFQPHLTYSVPQLAQSWGAQVDFYAADGKQNQIELASLIASGKLPKPSGNEYIYGVSFNLTYFSCKNTSILESSCPAKPVALLIP